MKRIILITICSFCYVFLFSNISYIRAETENVECLDNSVICIINGDADVVNSDDQEYNWTFVNNQIDKSKVKYKGDNNVVVLSRENVSKNNGKLYFRDLEITDIEKSRIGIQNFENDRNKITFYVNGTNNNTNAYVYYPDIGKYNGLQVGLKITIKGFSTENVQGKSKVKNRRNISFITLAKNEPSLDMYGVRKVTVEYSFWNSNCFSDDSFPDKCRLNAIKGFGTLSDIDSSQAVKLYRNNGAGGVDRAYIKGYDPICQQYDFNGTNYAGNETGKCNVGYTNNLKASHLFDDVESKKYKDYNNYSYLLPNVLPYEARGISSLSNYDFKEDRNYAFTTSLSSDIKLNAGIAKIENVDYIRYYRLMGDENKKIIKDNNIYTYSNAVNVKYYNELDAVSSPGFPTTNNDKHAWIQVLYTGSFKIDYYFNDYDFYGYVSGIDEYHKDNGSYEGFTGGKYSVVRYSGYHYCGYNWEKCASKGIGGGTYSFSINELAHIEFNPKNIPVKYRTINVNDPFTKYNGKPRFTGSNWCEDLNVLDDNYDAVNGSDIIDDNDDFLNAGLLIGDANRDGKVDIVDCDTIQINISRQGSYVDDIADFDRNGIVNMNDATGIQRYLSSLTNESEEELEKNISASNCMSDNAVVKKYIKNRPYSDGIYNGKKVNKPLYKIVLTPSTIKEIRNSIRNNNSINIIYPEIFKGGFCNSIEECSIDEYLDDIK